MCNLKRFLFGQFCDLFTGEAGFSYDGAHSYVGVDQVDGCIAFGVQHLLKREDVV